MADGFEVVTNSFLEYKKQFVKMSTLCIYRAIIQKHILPTFKERKQLEKYEINEFVKNKRNDGLSRKRIKDILVVLKRILRFAQKNHRRKIDVSEIRVPLKEEKKNIQVLSKKDERKLLSYLQENFSFENLGILICLQTGMRIGEICGLMWKDISLDCNEISVNRTIERIYLNEKEKKTELIVSEPKTIHSKRSIPLTSSLLKIRKPLKKIVNDSFYLLTNSSKPLEPRVYRNHFKKLLNDLGINPIKFHGLRHTFATRCIECNSNYKAVSSILGHSNISITLDLYVHPSNDEKKRCIENRRKGIEGRKKFLCLKINSWKFLCFRSHIR